MANPWRTQSPSQVCSLKKLVNWLFHYSNTNWPGFHLHTERGRERVTDRDREQVVQTRSQIHLAQTLPKLSVKCSTDTLTDFSMSFHPSICFFYPLSTIIPTFLLISLKKNGCNLIADLNISCYFTIGIAGCIYTSHTQKQYSVAQEALNAAIHLKALLLLIL